MTIIAFVRHGYTDWNKEGRTQGHSQNPLNAVGFKQAKAVARRLAEDHWDHLFSSDLLRARQTAEIISSHLGQPVTAFDERLREIDRGQTENTIEEERIAKWGKNWNELDLGVEYDLSLRKRGTCFVENMVRRYPDQNILVVSHGHLISQTLKALFQDETTGTNLGNTSVTTITKVADSWEYMLYNSTWHLETKETTQ